MNPYKLFWYEDIHIQIDTHMHTPNFPFVWVPVTEGILELQNNLSYVLLHCIFLQKCFPVFAISSWFGGLCKSDKRAHTPLSRLLVKMLNGTGPRTGPCSIPCVNSLQGRVWPIKCDPLSPIMTPAFLILFYPHAAHSALTWIILVLSIFLSTSLCNIKTSKGWW